MISKYQRWYEVLCDRARNRKIPAAYTEVHHVHPRSLGGSDDESNLVCLTYREHYIAHWLLTKFHTGVNLHKMQRALWAMTLKASGERLTAGWQVETAKRAVRDMELNDEVQAAADKRRRDKRNAEKLARLEEEKRDEAEAWASEIEVARTIFPSTLERVLARKKKRDAEIKQWGWYPMVYGRPIKRTFY